MEAKQEPTVWSQATDTSADSDNTTQVCTLVWDTTSRRKSSIYLMDMLNICVCAMLQVHFEGGTVAQIVYSGDQPEQGQQQVVYTADGSYASVESAEHTLVYIHPADGTQVSL